MFISISNLRSLMLVMLCVIVLPVANASQQEEAAGAVPRAPAAVKAASEWKTMVVQVSGRTVDGLQQTLQAVMNVRGDVFIVGDQASNTLILQGSEASLQACTEILKAINRPAAIIRFEVTVTIRAANPTAPDSKAAESTETDVTEPVIIAADKFTVSTLDETPVMVQLGQQTSTVSGMVMQAPGRTARSYQRTETGIIVGLTPRIEKDQIVTEFDFEKSWMGKPDPANAEAPGPTLKASSRTVLALKSGVSQTITAATTSDSAAAYEVQITVMAKQVDP